MTANQLVAYNLRRARERAGLTQEQAALRLERFLGRRWSKASFSAAETSITSGRTREFSADELVAFAGAFGVPIGFFFVPPFEDDLREDVTTGGDITATAEQLIELVAPLELTGVRQRLAEYADKAQPADVPEFDRRARRLAEDRMRAQLGAVVETAAEDIYKQLEGDIHQQLEKEAKDG